MPRKGTKRGTLALASRGTRGKLRMSQGLQNQLDSAVRAKRRRSVYRMLAKQNDGEVPCFVCGRPVSFNEATLEHVVPLSKGGTDDFENLSISHAHCNHRRGAKA